MDNREERHDWLVNQIYLHPNYIGIERQIISKNKELALIHQGDYFTVPDIFFLTKYSRTYVEVKSSHSCMLYDKGMRQLEKIIWWCNEYDKPIPDARLIMPTENRQNQSMIKELNEYRYGDSHHSPYKVYNNL